MAHDMLHKVKQFEHGGDPNCAEMVRIHLTAYAIGEAAPVMAEWVKWYLSHHCAGCLCCDDTKHLEGGLCYMCLTLHLAHRSITS
jgi:hypothetical protein